MTTLLITVPLAVLAFRGLVAFTLWLDTEEDPYCGGR